MWVADLRETCLYIETSVCQEEGTLHVYDPYTFTAAGS